MTCIAGVIEDGEVYLAGDSAGVDGAFNLTVRADTKVFRTKSYVMGFTSSFRMGQILHWSFDPPEPPGEGADLERFMGTTFVDAVRKCLGEGGYKKTSEGREEGGFFLVGTRGRLFEVECDFQVGEALDPWNAVGCGAGYALGSLHTTHEFCRIKGSGKVRARKRLLAALDAAQRHSAGVRGPFVILGPKGPPEAFHGP